jgi:Domain of unknown function (DUF4386)
MLRRLSPTFGVIFSAGLLASVILDGNAPDTHTVSGAQVIAFYTDHRDRMIASATLLVIAVSAGIVFYGILRDYLRREGDAAGMSATAFGGALILAGSACLGAGAALALTDRTSQLSPASAQTLSLLRTDVNTPFTSAGVAVLLLGFGVAILQSERLPRWVGWVALPFAIVSLIPPVAYIAAFVAAIWTLIVSAILYRQLASNPQASAAEVGGHLIRHGT